MAGELSRFGVSIEDDLLRQFDAVIRRKGYKNRSEALRDLIREDLIRKTWQAKGEIAGAITLIYDHHKRELVHKLMDIQHDFGGIIISSQHVHLDHDRCLEIIAVKGSPNEAEKLADRLKSIKGVEHGTLSVSGTGHGL